jgi:hypothetical protein
LLDEKPSLKPGDPVKLVGGLLTGASGLYAGMRGADRVAVLLAALGTLVCRRRTSSRLRPRVEAASHQRRDGATDRFLL